MHLMEDPKALKLALSVVLLAPNSRYSEEILDTVLVQ
jgi:hypothetical protein